VRQICSFGNCRELGRGKLSGGFDCRRADGLIFRAPTRCGQAWRSRACRVAIYVSSAPGGLPAGGGERDMRK